MRRSLSLNMRKPAALALASLIASASLMTGASARDLTFTGFGGSTQKAISDAYLKPFAAEKGINIVEDDASDLTKIRAMVQAGDVTWDIAEIDSADIEAACDEGVIEPLQFSEAEIAQLLPNSVTRCGLVAFTYANVMAYNADKIGEAPHSWADFWNVEKWPGRRGFWFTPKGTIEAALMADGVAPADVYKVLREPDGVDRAFRKLDELKPHILFWKTGAESVNRLASGEYAMTLAWTGRIDVANREDKQNFKIAWDSGFTYGQDLWAVVAGSSNKDLAIEAIRSTINPERQAEFMKLIAASAPVGKAYELLDLARLDALPLAGDHAVTGVKMDEEFWRENNEALTERCAAWAAQ